jgi:hypothetical protein
MIKPIAATALLGALLSLTVMSPAHAWTRDSSVTTPRGTYNSQGSGSCNGGNCAWSGGGTGPAGKTWSHQGSASCAGGSCTTTGSGTGPRGGTYSRTGTFTR